MNLHEFQSKDCLQTYGMPLLRRMIARDCAEADAVFKHFPGTKLVAKVQIHAGGRGKAGGVKIIEKTPSAIEAILQEYLGAQVVTHQTQAQGQPVHVVLFEECIEIQKEFYLAMLIDRKTQKISILASRQGGIHVEESSQSDPNHMKVFPLLQGVGILPHHAMNVAKLAYQLESEYSTKLLPVLKAMYDTFIHSDASLIEINPLILTGEDCFVALDAKMTLDDNAIYRQKEIASHYDNEQDDPKEVKAREYDLSYIALDGPIGCLVNGAGLAMATMDLIQYAGGSPANFLDVGGSATEERVTQAFQIILQDPSVNVILVNIFGGIVHCDVIAQGIIAAITKTALTCKVVVRLQGNQAKVAQQLLSGAGLNIVVEDDFLLAAQKAVQFSKG